MKEQHSIGEIFFKFLSQYQFDERLLDYTVMQEHIKLLNVLSEISNSGIQVFDMNKKETIYLSSNFGKMLGYMPADYEGLNHLFFQSKIHPEEQTQLALNGIATLKIFTAFSREEKLNHKVIDEYRMLNAGNKYVRVIEQYQVLELDKAGQIWLLFSIVDISPNQESENFTRPQLLNFKTGNLISLEMPQKPELELSKREVEILKLVKDGFLSKEISSRLSISVHTVNTHRQRLLKKLNANNSHEAVVFASKFGLLE